MTKIVVVAGSRDYNNYYEAKEYIDCCISRISKNYKLIFASGGCRGADLIGERYAVENGFQIKRYMPDWQKYGKRAGPLRNKQMADDGDYFICFWDGQSRGTKSMIDFVIKSGKPIRIKKI